MRFIISSPTPLPKMDPSVKHPSYRSRAVTRVAFGDLRNAAEIWMHIPLLD